METTHKQTCLWPRVSVGNRGGTGRADLCDSALWEGANFHTRSDLAALRPGPGEAEADASSRGVRGSGGPGVQGSGGQGVRGPGRASRPAPAAGTPLRPALLLPNKARPRAVSAAACAQRLARPLSSGRCCPAHGPSPHRPRRGRGHCDDSWRPSSPLPCKK